MHMFVCRYCSLAWKFSVLVSEDVDWIWGQMPQCPLPQSRTNSHVSIMITEIRQPAPSSMHCMSLSVCFRSQKDCLTDTENYSKSKLLHVYRAWQKLAAAHRSSLQLPVDQTYQCLKIFCRTPLDYAFQYRAEYVQLTSRRLPYTLLALGYSW